MWLFVEGVDQLKVPVFAANYVELAQAVVLANIGHRIICVDADEKKIDGSADIKYVLVVAKIIADHFPVPDFGLIKKEPEKNRQYLSAESGMRRIWSSLVVLFHWAAVCNRPE